MSKLSKFNEFLSESEETDKKWKITKEAYERIKSDSPEYRRLDKLGIIVREELDVRNGNVLGISLDVKDLRDLYSDLNNEINAKVFPNLLESPYFDLVFVEDDSLKPGLSGIDFHYSHGYSGKIFVGYSINVIAKQKVIKYFARNEKEMEEIINGSLEEATKDFNKIRVVIDHLRNDRNRELPVEIIEKIPESDIKKIYKKAAKQYFETGNVKDISEKDLLSLAAKAISETPELTSYFIKMSSGSRKTIIDSLPEGEGKILLKRINKAAESLRFS